MAALAKCWATKSACPYMPIVNRGNPFAVALFRINEGCLYYSIRKKLPTKT